MNNKNMNDKDFDFTKPLYIEYFHYIFSLGKYKYYSFSNKRTMNWLVTTSRWAVYTICIISILRGKIIAGTILFFESLYLLLMNVLSFANYYITKIIIYKNREARQLMEDYIHEKNN